MATLLNDPLIDFEGLARSRGWHDDGREIMRDDETADTWEEACGFDEDEDDQRDFVETLTADEMRFVIP